MPSRDRRAGRHDPRSEFPVASRADARARSAATIRRSRASHAQRADAIIVPSRVHRRRSRAAARRARRSHRRLPAGRAGTGRRARRRRATATCCSSARSSRERTSAALLDAYERLLGAVEPATSPPSSCSPGKATDEARPWLERIARPPLAGCVRHIGYVDPARPPRAVRRRAAARAAVVRGRVRHPGARGHDRSACRSSPPIAARCRKCSATPARWSTPRTRPDIAVAMARVLDDDGFAA